MKPDDLGLSGKCLVNLTAQTAIQVHCICDDVEKGGISNVTTIVPCDHMLPLVFYLAKLGRVKKDGSVRKYQKW